MPGGGKDMEKVNALRLKTVFGWTLTLGLACVTVLGSQAGAVDLDWTGDFRAENHWINNYRMNSANAQSGGYSIPGGSSVPQFQTLFLRLKPRVVVNDNVYLHSEWWLGNPAYGVFGDSAPSTADRRTFESTLSQGAQVSAQRFWAEVLTDVGNVHVGRAPLNWGLGLVWNAGNGVYDRFQSTGDVVRLVSKFGAFSFAPAAVKYSAGSSVSAGGLSDYAISLKYENPDDDFEGGVNFIRRVGRGFGSYSDSSVASDINTTTWDIFTRKKFGKFEVAAEAPIVSGKVSGVTYSSYALAGEGRMVWSETWNLAAKLGHIPGQGSSQAEYTGFFLHPNYKLGLILFQYQLANLGGANVGTAADRSVFNAPITNTNYLQLATEHRLGKWQLRGAWTYARALEVAGTTGSYFNQWSRKFESAGGTVAQSSALGWELDAGATLHWDDQFDFKADAGLFFPGDFFKYSAAASANQTGTVAAFVMGVGVKF
jgi:hypothetical protein